VRILKEPQGALTKQYAALLSTEGVEIRFAEDAIEALASYAFQVNQNTQNIGARRLYTIMERMLEDLSFTAPEVKGQSITIDATYVRQRLETLSQDEDLSKFIL
jgi:ATP-dependent HslUV protease ATP-binding subunit HslU